MRLWTIHPRYLDGRGVVALWREALLAQKVLRGKTKGYRNHPQLLRFRSHSNPEEAIAAYLNVVLKEAAQRGYRFKKRKISGNAAKLRINETKGQLMYEWEHLKHKIFKRNRKIYYQLKNIKIPDAHPFFKIVEGKVRDWEKVK